MPARRRGAAKIRSQIAPVRLPWPDGGAGRRPRRAVLGRGRLGWILGLGPDMRVGPFERFRPKLRLDRYVGG
jgi:hypothetical protein